MGKDLTQVKSKTRDERCRRGKGERGKCARKKFRTKNNYFTCLSFEGIILYIMITIELIDIVYIIDNKKRKQSYKFQCR